MNQLSLEKKVKIIHNLVRGNGIRGTAELAEVTKNSVNKVLVEVGKACREFHDKNVVNVDAKRIECDEQWGFVYSKQKNVDKNKIQVENAGDAWTWVAMAAESRLIVDWHVGARTAESASVFMTGLAARLKSQVELNTDGLRLYVDAVEEAFHGKINYAQLVKSYGTSEKDGKIDKREQYIGNEKMRICGSPDMNKISTSYVERVNLTTRMQVNRMARKTDGFSKKFENHCHAIALNYVYYNFVRIHSTLRVTPAMEAGLTNRLWEIADLVKLADEKKINSK